MNSEEECDEIFDFVSEEDERIDELFSFNSLSDLNYFEDEIDQKSVPCSFADVDFSDSENKEKKSSESNGDSLNEDFYFTDEDENEIHLESDDQEIPLLKDEDKIPKDSIDKLISHIDDKIVLENLSESVRDRNKIHNDKYIKEYQELESIKSLKCEESKGIIENGDDYLTKKTKVNDSQNFLLQKTSNNSDESNTELCFSGFKTASNREINVKIENIGNKNNVTKKPQKYKNSSVSRPARSYNKPEKGINKSEELEKLYKKLFKNCKKFFIKENKEWYKEQFRYVWLHLFINKSISDNEETEKKFIQILRIRKTNEYSVLRRIVEGDDVSYRYMVLLVLDVTDTRLELYDGYYSVYAIFDDEILQMIKRNELKIGMKLKVFGSEYVLNKNCSIFDVKDEPVLKLFYNSLCKTHLSAKLGYKKKVTFIRKISNLKKNGGIVSCIVGEVLRVIETKYLINVKDYKCSTSNLEEELERIEKLMDATKEEIKSEDVSVRKYVKFLFSDNTGECLITLWNFADDIKDFMKMRIIYLKPVESSIGLHLSTSKKTSLQFL